MVGEQLEFETTGQPSFDNWDDFANHLCSRSTPGRVGEIVSQEKRSLLWGLPQSSDTDTRRQLTSIARLYDGSNSLKSQDVEVLAWLKQASTKRSVSLDSVVMAIGVASVMPALAQLTSQRQWADASQHLLLIADNAVDQRNELYGLLATELKLTLSFGLPELQQFEPLWNSAVADWVDDMNELLDSDGALNAEYCRVIPMVLAIWTRCYLICRAQGFEIEDRTQLLWEWFVRYSMRLLRSDGTSMLSDPAIAYNVDLYRTAAKTSTDSEDREIARLLLPGGNPGNKKTRNFLEDGTFSEWAGLGVMQEDWSPGSPRLVVAICDQSIDIEVCRGESLFRISGLPDVSINGKSLRAVGEWDEVCSHFDDELDYLELEIELEDETKLQRQMCLIHGDETVLIADVVKARSTQRIDYQTRLILPSGVTPMQETENTEVYLRRKNIVSLVLPLDVPEWKSSDTEGKLTVVDQGLALVQSVLAKTLYAPLFVALNPRQSIKPRTWRKLTVAESLEIVDDDTARAYRIQIGSRQWVLYKTFGGAGNRTFLGQNHTCDLFIGRLKKDGNAKELLSLEP